MLILLIACLPACAPADPVEASGRTAARVDLGSLLGEKASLVGHREGASVGRDWRIGDVTGDAVPDLVVRVGGGPGAPHAWIRPGPVLGDAGRAEVSVVFPPWSGSLGTVEVADADGDGIADLWTGDGGDVWLVSGPIDGDVDLAMAPASPADGCRAGSALGDLDGDGGAEVTLVCGSTRYAVSRPSPERPLADTALLSAALSLEAIGDLDGDGLDDLAWQVPGSPYRVAYGPHVAVVDDASADTSVLVSGYDASLHPAGDVDGDGFLDVVASDMGSGGRSCVLAGPLASEVRMEDALATVVSGWDVLALEGRGLGDVDGDGFADLGGSDTEWPQEHPDYSGDPISTGAGWLAPGPLSGTLTATAWLKGQGVFTGAGEVRSAGDLDGDGLPEVGFADPGWRELYYDGGAVWFFGVESPLRRALPSATRRRRTPRR